MDAAPSESASTHRAGERAGQVDVSVVVPVLNGANLLRPARDAIIGALEPSYRSFELVLVDDGSNDSTWTRIRDLAADDRRVRGLRLASNVGQARATQAGIAATRGVVVATIDVDLETDARDLPALITQVEAGAGLASGRRTSRRAWPREAASRTFNRYARWTGLDLHDVGCGANAMSRDVAHAYVNMPDLGRELPTAVLARLSPSIVEVGMRSRRSEGSQMSFVQLVGLWVAFERRRRSPAGSGIAPTATPARPTVVSVTTLGDGIKDRR